MFTFLSQISLWIELFGIITTATFIILPSPQSHKSASRHQLYNHYSPYVFTHLRSERNVEKREGKLFAARSHGFSCSGPTSVAHHPHCQRDERVKWCCKPVTEESASRCAREDTFRHSRRQPTLTLMSIGKSTCAKCVLFFRGSVEMAFDPLKSTSILLDI